MMDSLGSYPGRNVTIFVGELRINQMGSFLFDINNKIKFKTIYTCDYMFRYA